MVGMAINIVIMEAEVELHLLAVEQESDEMEYHLGSYRQLPLYSEVLDFL